MVTTSTRGTKRAPNPTCPACGERYAPKDRDDLFQGWCYCCGLGRLEAIAPELIRSLDRSDPAALRRILGDDYEPVMTGIRPRGGLRRKLERVER